MRYILIAMVALFMTTPSWATSLSEVCPSIEAEMAELGVNLICNYLVEIVEDEEKYTYIVFVLSYQKNVENLLNPILINRISSYDDDVTESTVGVVLFENNYQIAIKMSDIDKCYSGFWKKGILSYPDCIAKYSDVRKFNVSPQTTQQTNKQSSSRSASAQQQNTNAGSSAAASGNSANRKPETVTTAGGDKVPADKVKPAKLGDPTGGARK